MELSKNKSTDAAYKTNNCQNDYEQQVSMISNQKKKLSAKAPKLFQKLTVLFLIVCIILIILLISTFYKLVQTRNKLDEELNKPEPIQHFRSFLPLEEEPKTECKTDTCYKAANFFHDYLNETIKPCDDFYQFSCGTWLKEQNENHDHFTTAYEKMIQDLSDILKHRPVSQQDSELIKNFYVYYQSCINFKEIEQHSDKDFIQFMYEKFGKWPLVGNLNLNDHGSIKYSSESLFGFEEHLANLISLGLPTFFRFDSDALNNHKNIIMKVQFDEDYCNLQKFLPKSDQHRVEFKKLLKTLKMHLSESFKFTDSNEESFDQQIDDLIKLANKIYFIGGNVYQCGRQDPSVILFKTVNELHALLNNNGSNTFDFNGYVGFLNEKATRKLDLDSDMVFPSLLLNYLSDMLIGLRELNFSRPRFQRAFSNFLYFKSLFVITKQVRIFRETHIQVMLPVKYYQAFFEYTKYIDENNPIDKLELFYKINRELICGFMVMDAFSMPDTEDQQELQNLFLTQKFNLNIKNHSSELLKKLINTSTEIVLKQKWIEDKTKKNIEKSLEELENKLVFSDTIFDRKEPTKARKNYNLTSSFLINNFIMKQYSYSKQFEWVGIEQASRLRSKNYKIDIFETNLMYFNQQNTLLMPAGVLIEPIFSLDYPIYLNYATIGTYLAHELFHLVDTELQKSGENTRNYYMEKIDCLKNNYIQYAKTKYNITIEGNNSVDEQISDNFGILVSYKTFLKELEKKIEMTDVMLPGVNYSPEQLFFIRYAESYCRKRTLDNRRQFEGMHVVHEYRSLQVTLIPEFSDVFKCGKNVFYNLRQCKIFEI